MRYNTLSRLGTLTIILGVALTMGCSDSGPKTEGWKSYNGASGPYQVQIDDQVRSDGLKTSIVHLQPVGQPITVSITGHSHTPGVWNRIFFCGLPETTNGCNSVVYDDHTSEWYFDPCKGDEGQVKRFSDESIVFAIAELNRSVLEIRNEDHLTRSWTAPKMQ